MAKKKYTFWFDETTIEKLRKLADKDNRSLTNLIETILTEKAKEKKK